MTEFNKMNESNQQAVSYKMSLTQFIHDTLQSETDIKCIYKSLIKFNKYISESEGVLPKDLPHICVSIRVVSESHDGYCSDSDDHISTDVYLTNLFIALPDCFHQQLPKLETIADEIGEFEFSECDCGKRRKIWEIKSITRL